MALSIEQIFAASYEEVIDSTPANQWEESAALREMQRNGSIEKRDFGPTIEVPLDYRANPDTAVLASDQDQSALLNTEILTAASYTPGMFDVTVTWTKAEEMKNPARNQKVDLVKAKLTNALASSDDLVEQLLFTSSSAGGDEIYGLDTIVPTSGAGTVGGINAAVETWWANYSGTYVDETDIEAAITLGFLTVSKGSGSPMAPTWLLSGATPFALFEATQQPLQRWTDGKEADAGFKTLKCKGMNFVYSQYGGSNIYLLNPKNFKLVVSKQYYRDKSETYPVTGQNAWYFKIFSGVQFISSNKSRLGVLHL